MKTKSSRGSAHRLQAYSRNRIHKKWCAQVARAVYHPMLVTPAQPSPLPLPAPAIKSPHRGLSWVDYSDIQVQFDMLSGDHMASWAALRNETSGLSVITVWDKTQERMIASVNRAERRIYGEPNKRQEIGLKRGFIDGLASVLRDVDVMDPAEQPGLLLKYDFIRTDHNGGMCPKCRCSALTSAGSRGDILGMSRRCKLCDHVFSWKAAGPFIGCLLPTAQIWQTTLLALSSHDIGVNDIANMVGVNRKSAYRLREIVRGNSVYWHKRMGIYGKWEHVPLNATATKTTQSP